jgi:hypothetical protein
MLISPSSVASFYAGRSVGMVSQSLQPATPTAAAFANA